MLGHEWKMCIYCIILMTWFNCKPSKFNKLHYLILPRLTASQTTVTLPKTATPHSC